MLAPGIIPFGRIRPLALRLRMAPIRKDLSPELLLPYEGGIERQFDRTLTQLERVQRMHLGQPVPPLAKLEVST